MGIQFFQQHGFAVPWWMTASGDIAETDLPTREVIVEEDIEEPPCPPGDGEGDGEEAEKEEASKLVNAVETAFKALRSLAAKLVSLLSKLKKKVKKTEIQMLSSLDVDNTEDEDQLEFCSFIGSSSLPHTASRKKLLNANVFFTYLENLDFIDGSKTYSVYASSDVSNTHNRARALDTAAGIQSSQPTAESLARAALELKVTERSPSWFSTLGALRSHVHKRMFALVELDAESLEQEESWGLSSASCSTVAAVVYGFDRSSVYCMLPNDDGMFVSMSWSAFEKAFRLGAVFK